MITHKRTTWQELPEPTEQKRTKTKIRCLKHRIKPRIRDGDRVEVHNLSLSLSLHKHIKSFCLSPASTFLVDDVVTMTRVEFIQRSKRQEDLWVSKAHLLYERIRGKYAYLQLRHQLGWWPPVNFICIFWHSRFPRTEQGTLMSS